MLGNFSSAICKRLSNSELHESIRIRIEINKKNKLLVGGIYKSPSSTDENDLSLFQLFDSVNNIIFKKLLMIGDFNFPEIDWTNWTTTTSENHNAYIFLECMHDNNLDQFVTSD